MDNNTCFKLNNEYRDVRLSTAGKLKEIQSFVDLTEEYRNLHPQSDLTELKLPHSINDVKTFLSDFDEYDSKKRYAFIRGMDGKYLCSQNGDRPMNRIERPVPLGWEVFCFEELGDSGKIALKSRGKYVSSENGERKMRCNRKSIGESEKFVLIQRGDIYVLKGNNGKFISCSAENDSLSCTSSCENDILSDNEKLQMEWISDFADEIKISWKHFDSYLSKLRNDFENAVQEKKKVNPENFYINSQVRVYDQGGDDSDFTYHQRKLFNQNKFKEAMQKADEKINAVKYIIWNQNNYLNGILWREKSDLTQVTKMLNKLVPAIVLLGGKVVTEENQNSMECSEKEYYDFDYDDKFL